MAMHKPRKFAVSPATRPNSEINVTPLVDVVLVLLIIFMVVTPLLEKDIEVRVPTTEQVEEVSEVPANQLVVSLDAEGRLAINSEVIEPAAYVERLKRVLAAKAPGDRLIFFMADEKANYGKLIAALDGAKAAGAETLGMMTELPKEPLAPEGPTEVAVPAAP
ncbi:MAG: ExbD/TolR family protein [Myxococcaceae bacterium]